MIRIFMIGMSTDKGGVESYITNLCKRLDKKNYDVVYCWPKMKINGKVWVCPPNRHNYFKYKLFWERFYRENHFDVVYYNTCDIVSIDQLKFAKKANVSVRIIHSHNTNNQMKIKWYHRCMEVYNRRHIRQVATHLFACSEVAGKWMFQNECFTIIKNGISLSKYAYNVKYRNECRLKLGIEKEYLIGWVGRLDLQKNPLFPLKLMKNVLQYKQNIKFVYIGDGEFRKQIEEKIKEHDLQDKMFVLGARDDVHKWYSAFDSLLMPSLFEGLPFVLVEAQAAGLPCVVSSTVSKEADLTGLIDFVSLEESFEVWAERVINACIRMRQDTNQRLIDAGYSIEETARIMTDIIENSL